MPHDNYRVGLIQMSCTPDTEQNLERAIEHIREAAARGAQVVCLPELFRTQYFCQREDAALFDLAEPIPGPTTTRLGEVARENKVVVIASIFEKRAAGVYHNTAAVLDCDGSLRGIYRKMHIPDDPLYYEKFYFTPGDLGFRAFDVHPGVVLSERAAAGESKDLGERPASADPERSEGAAANAPTRASLRVGTLICWDQWYPEAARLTALQGADILFYPTAIGWHPAEKQDHGASQRDAWRTVQRSHAISNGVFVAVVNRVGHETGNVMGKPSPGAGLEFWGCSFLCDPFGTVLAEAPPDREAILLGEIDLRKLEEIRRNWPFLRDRRIDSYSEITQRLLDKTP